MRDTIWPFGLSYTWRDILRVTRIQACEAADFQRDDRVASELPMWRECFSAIEAALLHVAPVYYGLGFPPGDQSAVVVIPGFLGTDAYLV